MSKHTPGPWNTDEKDHDDPYQDIRVVGSRRNICLVWMDDAPVKDYNDEQQANARLIAAAPDLLEALKSILPFIPKTSFIDGGAAKYSENVIAADKVRAAITKATGQ